MTGAIRGIDESLCLDFANAFQGRPIDWERLREGLSKAGVLGPAPYPSSSPKALDRARRLWAAIHAAFSQVAEGGDVLPSDLAVIEREANLAHKALRLEPSGDSYAWALCYDGDPGQVLAPIALSAAGLLTGDGLSRVRICANETCRWLFLDHSKNRSRKWCDMADCGNKMKARRHYEKVRAAKRAR